MYAQGATKCTICNENYAYVKRSKQSFNYKGCIIDVATRCLKYGRLFMWFAIWAFINIGISYNSTFTKVYSSVENDYFIGGIFLPLAYIVTTVYNIVWIIAITTQKDEKTSSLFKKWLVLLILQQTIGVLAIYILSREIIFNIVSMCVGTFLLIIAACLILLVGFSLYHLGKQLISYKNRLIETYTVSRVQISI